MKSLLPLTFLFALVLACSSQRHVPDFSDRFEYDTRVALYVDDEITLYEYYDRNGLLIHQVGSESRSEYFYDSEGKLIEVKSCSRNNCDYGWRSLMIYDTHGNHIATYRTPDSSVNLDTVKYEQVMYYNEQNLLTKELVRKGKGIYGDEYERWRYYSYELGNIQTEIETSNRDTIWIGSYKYDSSGNLIAIHKRNGEIYKNVKFEYDDRNRLILKTFESNEYPLTKNVSFSASNCQRKYEYDEQNRLIKETVYNHLGKERHVRTYEYAKKRVDPGKTKLNDGVN